MMLSFSDAKALIERQVPRLKTERLALDDCLESVLARDIISPTSNPAFDNSAVDGFALAVNSDKKGGGIATCKLRKEIPAGQWPQRKLAKGEAARVFTGAPVPPGTFAVVMQENVECIGDRVIISQPVKRASHIRRQGEDFERGAVLLKAGTLLKPFHLALLATAGLAIVPVYKRIDVARLITGSELVPPAQKSLARSNP